MLLTHTIETHGHTIETYGRRPHNRNIWSHTIARRRPFVTPGRFFCLCFTPPSTHYLHSPFLTRKTHFPPFWRQNFFSRPTTLLFKILGGRMHGPSPTSNFGGTAPQSSLGLRPCKKDIFAPSHVPFRPLNQPLLEKVGLHPVILRNKFI